jgi:hypothetical protein
LEFFENKLKKLLNSFWNNPFKILKLEKKKGIKKKYEKDRKLKLLKSNLKKNKHE